MPFGGQKDGLAHKTKVDESTAHIVESAQRILTRIHPVYSTSWTCETFYNKRGTEIKEHVIDLFADVDLLPRAIRYKGLLSI